MLRRSKAEGRRSDLSSGEDGTLSDPPCVPRFLRLPAMNSLSSLRVDRFEDSFDVGVPPHLVEREPELVFPAPLRNTRNVLGLGLEPQIFEVHEHDFSGTTAQEPENSLEDRLRIACVVRKQALRLEVILQRLPHLFSFLAFPGSSLRV